MLKALFPALPHLWPEVRPVALLLHGVRDVQLRARGFGYLRRHPRGRRRLLRTVYGNEDLPRKISSLFLGSP